MFGHQSEDVQEFSKENILGVGSPLWSETSVRLMNWNIWHFPQGID